MKGISVNLLPQEIILQRHQSAKYYLINKISIIILAVMIFLASTTLSLRLSQNFALRKVNQDVAYAQEKITSMQSKEEQLVTLKTRLGTIKTLKSGDAKKRSLFNLIVSLAPDSVGITEVTIDRNGNMLLSFVTPKVEDIEIMVSSLTDKEKNMGLISKVELEGLSVGKENIFRVNLNVGSK